jgi:hypothetical protein
VVTDYTAVNLNVQMIPGAGVTTALVSAVTGSTATGGGNVICEGNSPVTARGLCWSTAIYPLITGPHTTESGTAGAFTSMMTNLSPATTYHVRAYVTDGLGTVYGNDVQFTTECGTIATFPWHEGFENGGAIPACWTQQQVSNSGINWKFITGNGGLNPELSHNGEYNACLSDILQRIIRHG